MTTLENILDEEWPVDDEVKLYLHQTAVLAKFIAAIGMIFAVLTTIKTGYGIVRSLAILRTYYFNSMFSVMNIVIALLAGAIYFSVSLFTYRFATKMQEGLAGADQLAFNTAWNNFKLSYKIMGILFIIYIVLLLILFIM
ncbi:MAG: hypothetical protein EOO92_27510 [Pedobacter sp.]|nr:MAG: hypothetical protein EOO92_27510 [Pedobacter sp.]